MTMDAQSLREVAVLLVEDDEEDQFLTVDVLRQVASTRYDVTWVTNVPDALTELATDRFDVALLDYRLGAHTALDILQSFPDDVVTPCILLTGQRDLAIDLAAMEAGAADYLVKGDLSPVELERSIRYAVDRAGDLRSLRDSEERFRSVVEAATDAIVLTDDSGALVSWNRSTLDLFGLDDAAAAASTLTDLIVGAPCTPAELARLDLGAQTELGIAGRRHDGTSFPIAVSVSGWQGRDGQLWSLIIRDVTTQRQLEARLVHQALHDPLTKLANRALFTDRVEHALNRLDRNGAQAAVLFLDLDDFKRINDSYGHAAGDAILLAAANRLDGCVRATDTVARLGGDEFAVLVEDMDDPLVALDVADRVTRALSSPFSVGRGDLHVSCSVGVALASPTTADANVLLRDADVAMYAAKARGKNCTEVFEAHMHTSIMDRVRVEADLQRAVQSREFVAFYQPIVDLATGELRSVEALARWRHPERGLLPPGVFIDTAEATGWIVPIGRMILRDACRQTRAWQIEHDLPDLAVSVNLSPRQIEDPSIVDTVGAALAASGLEPRCLTLEITESLVVKTTGDSRLHLEKLAELGVGIAIDDFGTGYSALSYLQDLPLTVLKVDRSFVNRLGEPRGAALVHAIVGMGTSLGLDTVAEGIEDEEQLAALAGFGCRKGQGFLFAQPTPAEEFDPRTAGRVPVG